MRNFFIADTHFGHDNIRRLAQRHFANVDEMDEEMIARWNEVVDKDDFVYHLGDFAFRKTTDNVRKTFAALNGKKILIKGNHDNGAVTSLKWERVVDYERGHFVVDGIPRVIVMFHYPISEWDMAHRGSYHLHGHTHRNCPLETGSNFVRWRNVGAELSYYRPVQLEELFDWNDDRITK